MKVEVLVVGLDARIESTEDWRTVLSLDKANDRDTLGLFKGMYQGCD